jgi:hypothetical protein
MGGNSTARLVERQRDRITRRERELRALAGCQHGVVTRAQLLDAGLSPRTIERRVERKQIHRLHRGVYAFGEPTPTARGQWLAAVLACGGGALLSHRSAAALWGFARPGRIRPVELTCSVGRGQRGLRVHEGGIHDAERTIVDRIPVTSVARTIFDLAEVVDADRLASAGEEADRLHLLRLPDLEAVCASCPGRRALAPIRRLIEEIRAPETPRSPLEDRVLALCRDYELPIPATNVLVLDHEVDALWPREKLIVEADSVKFHGHRAAFERDRERDAARQVAGYRVIRLTDRRLKREPEKVAQELRRLLNPQREGGRAGS